MCRLCRQELGRGAFDFFWYVCWILLENDRRADSDAEVFMKPGTAMDMTEGDSEETWSTARTRGSPSPQPGPQSLCFAALQQARVWSFARRLRGTRGLCPDFPEAVGAPGRDLGRSGLGEPCARANDRESLLKPTPAHTNLAHPLLASIVLLIGQKQAPQPWLLR